jgi:hypothetical protein
MVRLATSALWFQSAIVNAIDSQRISNTLDGQPNTASTLIGLSKRIQSADMSLLYQTLRNSSEISHFIISSIHTDSSPTIVYTIKHPVSHGPFHIEGNMRYSMLPRIQMTRFACHSWVYKVMNLQCMV